MYGETSGFSWMDSFGIGTFFPGSIAMRKGSVENRFVG
jgi:hypothetical protein